MQVDPCRLACVLKAGCGGFDDRRVGPVHESSKGFANDLEALSGQVDGDRHRDHWICPEPACQVDDEEPPDHADAGPDIREDVSAVGLERDGIDAFPCGREKSAEHQIRDGTSGEDREADVEASQVRARQQASDALGENDQRREGNGCPLHRGRQELDLAVTVGVILVWRPSCDRERQDQHARADDVDGGFHRVGEDGGRSGDQIGGELRDEDQAAREQRDSSSTHSLGLGGACSIVLGHSPKIRGFWSIGQSLFSP